MIEILVNPDGSITALVANEAIKPGFLKQILCWKAEHCTDQDVITRSRQKTVPTGYKYSTCKNLPHSDYYNVHCDQG